MNGCRIALVILLLAGCSKQQEPDVTTPAPRQSSAPAAPPKNPPQPTKAVPSAGELQSFVGRLNSTGVGIGIYTNPDAVAMGERPTAGTIFNLNFMQVVQKVPDGYFLQWAPPGQAGSGELVFLRTNLELTENALFLSGGYWAVFTGPYQYQAVNGFNRTVYRFVLLNRQPTTNAHDVESLDQAALRELMNDPATAAWGIAASAK